MSDSAFLKTRSPTVCDTQAWGSQPYRMAEGLIAPSARHQGGVNVVLFPGHRRDGSLIVVRDEADIPFMHGL